MGGKGMQWEGRLKKEEEEERDGGGEGGGWMQWDGR